MPYIVLIAVIGILFLQLTGAIPLSSVGGPLVIAAAVFVAALALAVHEAWTRKRGVLGWIVNIVVVLLGAFVAAQLGEAIVIGTLALLRPLVQVEGSLASTGGPLLFVSLAAMMAVTLLGSWGALWVVNRWR
ncbi:hypothetical protein [Rhodopseudomonas sp. B29]|uniref:hypothetical protein n=1 Tax=Rhodopseudomonas sp. B29 TaxID=95607 RepID=UPI00034D3493|nr:hypothetical protein [Rhodopseudomonas sp. B29]